MSVFTRYNKTQMMLESIPQVLDKPFVIICPTSQRAIQLGFQIARRRPDLQVDVKEIVTLEEPMVFVMDELSDAPVRCTHPQTRTTHSVELVSKPAEDHREPQED